MKNKFTRISVSHYQKPNSKLRVPRFKPRLLRAFKAAKSKLRPSSYGRTTAAPTGEKRRHNLTFAKRLSQADESKYGLVLDGARLTTTQYVLRKKIALRRLIVPNPCTAKCDGLEILRKRLRKNSKYRKLCHVFLSLQQLLALHLPPVDALEGSIAVAWLDLMYKVTTVTVVRDQILVPFFERKWLVNETGSYFAITLCLRGIEKIAYETHIRFWKREVLRIAGENGYNLRYIEGVPDLYRNGGSNMIFLSFEIPAQSARQTRKRQR